MKPERLAHFEIIETIGRGGFASVQRARDTRLGREVAIKRLRPDVTANPDARRRIVQEAQVIAQLGHPGIVTLHDIISQHDSVALVMELVTGGTLATRLKDGRLGARAVASLGAAIAEALAHAHEHGVIHRDLKPSNLLLSQEGRVKVSDFGLARLLPGMPLNDGALAAETPIHTLVGTPHYMAPEQIRGLPCDRRSDVFSLCIVLHEAATGRRPFEAAGFYATATAIIETEPEWPAELGAPEELALNAVLKRGLSKDPALRYQDMRALKHDLERVAREESLAEAPAPATASSLVDRESELARLSAALQDALKPGARGRVLLLSGEAGIGKTALLDELTRRSSGIRIARESFREGRRGIRPVADALARLVEPREPGDPSWSALRESRAGSGAEPAPSFGELVGDVLVAAAARGPFLLALENAHAADRDALSALRAVCSTLPATPGLLILSYRSEEEQTGGEHDSLRGFLVWLRGEHEAEEIALGRLAADHTLALIGKILPSARAPRQELVEYLQAETEGNPLFVRETLRFLVETGKLAGDGTLQGERLAPSLPGRVRDILLRRIEALAPELKAVLEAASVAGESFSSDAIVNLLDVTRGETLRRLQALVRVHHLLIPSGDDYRFDHTKIREVVYASLIPELRAEHHARMARHLSESAADRRADIARHLVAAGQQSAALPHLLAAAQEASRRAATEQARALYAQASEVLAAQGPRAVKEHLDVLLELGQLEQTSGLVRAARERFETVARLATAPRLKGMAVHYLGWLDLQAGDSARAAQRFERARAAFEKAGDPIWVAACRDSLGVCLRHAGRLDEAAEEARAALAMRRRLGFEWGVALSQSNLGSVYYQLGRYARALDCFESSCAYFRKRGQLAGRQRLATALLNVGIACHGLGRLERSLAAYAEALGLQRAIGNRLGEAMTIIDLALLHLDIGLETSAAHGFERGAELARALGHHALQAHALSGLAAVMLAHGRPETARATAEQALEEARLAHDVEAEAPALLELARALTRLGSHAEAERALSAAFVHLRRGRLEEPLAQAHHIAAELSAASGDGKAAGRSLEAALKALKRRPRPELAWRVRHDLARARLARDPKRAKRELAQARSIVRRMAESIADPALKRIYTRQPERAALLGIELEAPDAQTLDPTLTRASQPARAPSAIASEDLSKLSSSRTERP